jgi:serine/threonine protein kinase
MSELLNNRYRILQTLGSGGFGDTFLAEDTNSPSKRQCVIKRLKPKTDDAATWEIIKERFEREAAILEKLGEESSQIPSLKAYFDENHEFYLVQDWTERHQFGFWILDFGFWILDFGFWIHRFVSETKRKTVCLPSIRTKFHLPTIRANLFLLHARRRDKTQCRRGRTAAANNRKSRFAWRRSSADCASDFSVESQSPEQSR